MLMVGILCLGIWFGAIGSRTNRWKILLRSTWLVGLPFFIFFLLSEELPILGLVLSIAVIAIPIEELYKLILSRIVRTNLESLSLLLLFGVWEIFVIKAIRPLSSSVAFSHMIITNLPLTVIILIASASLQGCVAIIYSNYKNSPPYMPFIMCCALHFIFNYTTIFYSREVNGNTQFNYTASSTQDQGTIARRAAPKAEWRL